MPLFDFEPKLEQIGQTVSENADEDLTKKIQLYIFMRNFFAAMAAADECEESGGRIPRYVFEKVGIDGKLYELGNMLVIALRWKSETFSWELLQADQKALVVLERVASVVVLMDVEYWADLQNVETRASAHVGQKYELDDFFREFPHLDFSIDRRLSGIQDTNLREILKQQELRERKRDQKEAEEARRRERAEERRQEQEEQRARALREHFQQLTESIRGGNFGHAPSVSPNRIGIDPQNSGNAHIQGDADFSGRTRDGGNVKSYVIG